jgi:hypothetical protein
MPCGVLRSRRGESPTTGRCPQAYPAARRQNEPPAVPDHLAARDAYAVVIDHVIACCQGRDRSRLSPASVLETLQLTLDVRAALIAAKRPDRCGRAWRARSPAPAGRTQTCRRGTAPGSRFDVGQDRYSLALLVTRSGRAVAHYRLGPSPSASTSTAVTRVIC